MTFDWRLYIDLADELTNHPRTSSFQDAYYRTAISRSYYGVYHFAKKILTDKGCSMPSKSQHQYVRETLSGSSVRTERRIGVHLGRLWKDRVDADYNEVAPINKNRAITTYLIAKNTLDLINSLPL